MSPSKQKIDGNELSKDADRLLVHTATTINLNRHESDRDRLDLNIITKNDTDEEVLNMEGNG